MRLRVCVLVLFSFGVLQAQQPGPSQPTVTRESKFATVYGAKIHYVEEGTGPVVVLVHGLADDTTVWEAVISPLAERHRVIVPDLIGFGKSDKPLLGYRVGTFVDFLNGFLQQLKIEKATLIGNSLGGWVVTAFAIQHPQKVEKLVPVGAVGFASVEKTMPIPLDTLSLSTREEIRALLVPAYANQALVNDQMIDAILEQRVRNADGYTIATFIDSMRRREDVVDGKLGGLRMPTLVVWGAQDRLTPTPLGQRFRREIPNARLHIIDNCGHMPQQECPKDFVQAVLPFLQNN